jgi:LPXTG-motif cell wall-anchored protein
MKKLRLALAVAVVAFFAVLTPSPAQAYPGVTVNVSERTVVGGHDIKIRATVDPDVNCQWTLIFLGETRHGSGSSITRTFETPEVDDVEYRDAVAICDYDDTDPALDNNTAMGGGGGVGSLGASLVTAPQQAADVGTQTLLPEDDDDDGDDDGDGDGDDDGDDDGNGGGGDNGGLLPNTGGERLAWLIIGGMLVLVGGGVVVASRRRDA